MRLSSKFGMIAIVLTALVVGLVAVPALHGQSVVVRSQRGEGPAMMDVQRNVEVLVGGPRLGVSIKDVDATKKPAGPSGVVIEGVEKDSAAAKAGLKEGDLVVQYDGEAVRSTRQFTRLVRESAPGRAVKIGVMRDGKRLDLEATPAERADEAGSLGGLVRPEIDLQLRKELEGVHENLRQFRMPREVPEPGGPDHFFFYGGPRAGGGEGNFFGMREGRGRLGVTVQDLTPELSTFFGVKDGVLVSSVRADSAAAKAGLKAGDVITTLNDKPVKDSGDLVSALGEKDGEVTIGVMRDKKPLSLKATLEERSRPRGVRMNHTPA